MDQNSAKIIRVRHRDVRLMAGAGLMILAGLTVIRALALGPAIIAGFILLIFTYLYRLNLEATATPSEPAATGRAAPSRAQAVLEAQRAIVAGLSQPAFIVRDKQVQIFNAAAGQLFNLPDNAVLPVESLRHPGLLAQLDLVTANQSTGQPSNKCEIIPARFPDQHWLAELTLLDGPDRKTSAKTSGILVVLKDQAPIRQAERARADFLANASHELRTPLTSISGFVETMQGPASDDLDAWPRFIEIIAEQANHMNGLISDLLSLSRIELGEHEAPIEAIQLHQILPEAIEAMSHMGKARDLKIDLDLPASTPLVLTGFEIEVKQVVQNLVSNAMKYAPNGGKISVRAGHVASLADAHKQARNWQGAGRATLLQAKGAPAELSNGAIWLSVRDNGPGIDAEHLPRLGERFFRVDASRGGPVEGTGLGLAIVKHIMAHHQGGLAVESIAGEGSQFTVWFRAA